MKKYKIIFLIISILTIFTIYVNAFESEVIINGESEVKVGETKIATIKITSDTDIGMVSGKIEKNANITNIKVTGKNNWNLMYNSGTGVFNIYKAEGAKTEEIIDIEYTVSNTEGTGSITLSNIKVTNTDYELKEMANVTKTIMIKGETIPEKPEEPKEPENTELPKEKVELESIEIKKQPNKKTYTEGEKFEKTGMIVTAKYSDGSSKEITDYTYLPTEELKTSNKKITITYKENEKTVNTNVEIEVKAKAIENKEEVKEDSTISNKPIPPAGIKTVMILVITIVLTLSITFYVRYRNIDK